MRHTAIQETIITMQSGTHTINITDPHGNNVLFAEIEVRERTRERLRCDDQHLEDMLVLLGVLGGWVEGELEIKKGTP